MFVRTGLSPKEAKAKLSAREAAEFFAFCTHNPIDDQSNFHYPIAALHANFINMKQDQSAPKRKLREFLLFRDPEETDLEDDILNGDW